MFSPGALISIFPYSRAMVKDFHMDIGKNISFYDGILILAFSLAEALTGIDGPSFWVALAGRALDGALNGNVAVIQTVVGELVKRLEHEPRAYAIMPFIWSIETIVGPAIGGLLEGFPYLFPAHGPFGRLSYLLPHMETHPEMQPDKVHGNFDHTAEQPLLVTSDATANAGVDLRVETYGTFNQTHPRNDENWNF
ncbi:Tetracycline resistance protein TetA/multidrug resistance protein MdtG [Penicillium paradoxum]|uniref:Tetracycline resistance protein TetA/multidrug resistance protein MdtG n=1 Tax=Penicillium paradoxum TaxID=176176 RepID=UPI0025484749|nr:Tetracycline resistance protein TetA/multidrug resistance protein MdtG [Penicillium paradoxum]KAJ5782211.1 Tetracycline resistance protein TetA/multidrug resistance protein MdtG [Penicillium paradoxum]